MIYDMEMQKTFYASYAEKVEKARKKLGRAMTLAEKNIVCTFIRRKHGCSFPSGGRVC